MSYSFSLWDPNDSFFKHYATLTPEQKEALHHQASNTKIEEGQEAKEEAVEDDASSYSTASTSSYELEPVRTARMSRTATNKINSRNESHPEALGRIETHRSQHYGTVAASRKTTTKESRPLPSMGAGKAYPPCLPEREEYVVEFDGVDDPMHAQNWPMNRKLAIGAMLAFDALSATMGSSIFSASTRDVAALFHVSMEVSTLGTSLFVLGYAFGPILWAPLYVFRVAWAEKLHPLVSSLVCHVANICQL